MTMSILIKKKKIRWQIFSEACVLAMVELSMLSLVVKSVFFSTLSFWPNAFTILVWSSAALLPLLGHICLWRFYTQIEFRIDYDGFYCEMPTRFSKRKVFVPWSETVISGRMWNFPFYGITDKDIYTKGMFRHNKMQCYAPGRDWIENIEDVDAVLENVPPNVIKNLLQK